MVAHGLAFATLKNRVGWSGWCRRLAFHLYSSSIAGLPLEPVPPARAELLAAAGKANTETELPSESIAPQQSQGDDSFA